MNTEIGFLKALENAREARRNKEFLKTVEFLKEIETFGETVELLVELYFLGVTRSILTFNEAFNRAFEINQEIAAKLIANELSVIKKRITTHSEVEQYILIGKVFLDMNQPNEAIDYFRKFLEVSKTNNFEAYILLGAGYKFLNNNVEEERMYTLALDEAITSDNKEHLAIIYGLFGYYYIEKGDKERGIEMVQKVIEYDPIDHIPHTILIVNASSKNIVKNSLKILFQGNIYNINTLKLLLKYEKDKELVTWYNMLNQRETQEIIEIEKTLSIDKIAQLNLSKPKNAVFRALLVERIKDNTELDKLLEIISPIRDFRNFTPIKYKIGVANFYAGNYIDARDILLSIVETCPIYKLAHYYLGVTYFMLGEYQEAINKFDELIVNKSSEKNYHYYKGLSLAKLRDHKNAIQSFNEALYYGSDSYEIWHNLGLSLIAIGENEKGNQSINKAIELNPSLKDALIKKGIEFI